MEAVINTGSLVNQTWGSDSRLCHLPAAGPQATYLRLTNLSKPSCLISNMGNGKNHAGLM